MSSPMQPPSQAGIPACNSRQKKFYWRPVAPNEKPANIDRRKKIGDGIGQAKSSEKWPRTPRRGHGHAHSEPGFISRPPFRDRTCHIRAVRAYRNAHRGNLARTGGLNVLLQAALKADPRIKDAPMVIEAAHSADERKALELFFARAAMGRPFVAPPGVPADRLAALRTAFDAAIADPAFLDDARKQNLTVVPVAAREMTEIVSNAIFRSMATLSRRSSHLCPAELAVSPVWRIEVPDELLG